MKIQVHKTALFTALAAIIAVGASASAQSILFDFNNAPDHTSLPLQLTQGGITASLSAGINGYSIQDSSAPVFPSGFSGLFLYPNSIYGTDVMVSFNHTLTDFSILYAAWELGCDDSCTVRVTAYMGSTLVGFVDHTAANPGTVPVDTLACSYPQGFDNVVLHWQHAPPTCQDYGPNLFYDNMRVTPGSSFDAVCFGDGSNGPCPCGNTGLAGHGCNNSAATGGSVISASGVPSLSADTVVLHSSFELPSSLSIVIQGDAFIGATNFGDGLRCAGGTLHRLYTKHAVGGVVIAPQAGDLSISARSAAEGDVIPLGATRAYQIYYRDPNLGFCSPGFNVSNAMLVAWGS